MRRLLIVAVLAGLMVVATAGAAFADEGCGTTCSVGAFGTGGESSDGNAQGFRLKGLSTGFPGSTFTNQGTEMAGHIAVTGPIYEGSGSGAFTPQGEMVGHWDGVTAIFFGLDGDCNGICTPE